jgi:dipeptidyl aminopeptidase/acylaminoacyl peptidase
MNTPDRRLIVVVSLALVSCVVPPQGVAAGGDAEPKAAGAGKNPDASRLNVEDYLEWERVSDPQISPSGGQIVYTRQWVDKVADKWASALWTVEADGSKNRFLVEGSEARWSPDGTRIAYLAEGKPKGTQVFVRWMDETGAVSQITRVDEPASNLRWSPDSKAIAFTMLVPKEDTWKIAMPAPPKGAAWTEAPRVIETRNYRLDRKGFLGDGYVHVFLVPADSGTPLPMTEGRWNVGARPEGLPFGAGIDWSPDGSEIYFDGLREEDADDRYRESHIYAVDVRTRAVRQITKVKGPWRGPAASHDGRWIAFTGHDWTPQTYKAQELCIIGRDGGGMRRIAADLDRDPQNLHWAPDDSGVYFTAGDRGTANVWFASLAGGARQVTEGAQLVALASMATDGTAAGTLTAPHEPGDVVKLRLSAPGAMARLTRVNEDVLAGKSLGAVEEIWYDSSGGARVQGWIVKPPDFDASTKHPLILHIHGGPHAMYGVNFDYSFQNLAANGYVVFYPNPRGSTGYGTAFGNAIDDAYPSVDYEDLMAGVDAVIARGYVDPDRLYVTGVSGGGVLSSWTVGHTDRFAAAAVRAPVINWISFAGTTDITAWGYMRYRGYPWEAPEKWLKHSPLMYVKNVKTPTLLMTGELDLRTPMGQTEEYYQALKALKVPTALIRFNDEYHGTGSKPSNFMRTQLYLLSWFAKHPGEAARPGGGRAGE